MLRAAWRGAARGVILVMYCGGPPSREGRRGPRYVDFNAEPARVASRRARRAQRKELRIGNNKKEEEGETGCVGVAGQRVNTPQTPSCRPGVTLAFIRDAAPRRDARSVSQSVELTRAFSGEKKIPLGSGGRGREARLGDPSPLKSVWCQPRRQPHRAPCDSLEFATCSVRRAMCVCVF